MDKDLLREVATTADGRDITRGFVDSLPLLPPLDRVLQQRGGGDYRVYEELLRDDQVAACFMQLRLAVVGSEWQVHPGGERRIDKRAAEDLQAQLKELDWDRVTDRMLYGLFYGYAVAEAIYARDGNRIKLADIIPRKARRFGFSPRGELRLRTTSAPLGEPVPDKKFWHFAYGGDSGDEPYGLGLAHALYWPVFFKRAGIKFWMIFLEKFGAPTAKGEFPANATEAEKQKLLAALSAINTDSGVIVPEGMKIDLLEAARSGTADYTELVKRMDAAIAKVILGQSATTEGTPGKLGNEDTQNDVRQEVTKAAADLVCSSFNRTVAQWLTEWNYPGAMRPNVWRQTEPDEDLNQRAERDSKVSGMGFRPTLETINETYPGEWEEKPAPSARPAGGTGPAFAEADEDEGDRYLRSVQQRLADETAAPIDAMMRPIEDLLARVNSFEEFKAGLEEAFKEMDPKAFSQVMGDAIAAARLAGRFDVLEGM